MSHGQISSSVESFIKNFYSVISDKPGNLFFSPISAHSVLSMAYQGAEGITKEAFTSFLRFEDPKLASEGYSSVLSTLRSLEKVTLFLANNIFVPKNFPLAKTFQEIISGCFFSEVQSLDFENNDEAAKRINKRVDDNTKNKIQNLFSASDFDNLTRLVLVSSIYFKGEWKDKFNRDRTEDKPFYLNETESVDVKMMTIKHSYLYKEDKSLDFKMLKVPYRGNGVNMVIILPNKKNGLPELEKRFESMDLRSLACDMKNRMVDLTLPRFKMEVTIDLKEIISKMGLQQIFNKEEANFTKIIEADDSEPLYVSNIVQKAFIDVDEDGTEATAATGLKESPRSRVPEKSTNYDVFTASYQPTKANRVEIQKSNIKNDHVVKCVKSPLGTKYRYLRYLLQNIPIKPSDVKEPDAITLSTVN